MIIEQTPASLLASKLHEVKTTSDLLTGYREYLVPHSAQSRNSEALDVWLNEQMNQYLNGEQEN